MMRGVGNHPNLRGSAGRSLLSFIDKWERRAKLTFASCSLLQSVQDTASSSARISRRRCVLCALAPMAPLDRRNLLWCCPHGIAREATVSRLSPHDRPCNWPPPPTPLHVGCPSSGSCSYRLRVHLKGRTLRSHMPASEVLHSNLGFYTLTTRWWKAYAV